MLPVVGPVMLNDFLTFILLSQFVDLLLRSLSNKTHLLTVTQTERAWKHLHVEYWQKLNIVHPFYILLSRNFRKTKPLNVSSDNEEHVAYKLSFLCCLIKKKCLKNSQSFTSLFLKMNTVNNNGHIHIRRL